MDELLASRASAKKLELLEHLSQPRATFYSRGLYIVSALGLCRVPFDPVLSERPIIPNRQLYRTRFFENIRLDERSVNSLESCSGGVKRNAASVTTHAITVHHGECSNCL